MKGCSYGEVEDIHQHKQLSRRAAEPQSWNCPPMQKATVDQQAARLRQRALDLQQKGMKDEMLAICKKRPDLVPLLLQHAYSLGAERARAADDMVVPMPSSPKGKTDNALVPISPQDNDAKPTHKRGEVSTSIPRCHQVWSTVPVQYLVHVMARAEPIALVRVPQPIEHDEIVVPAQAWQYGALGVCDQHR